MITKKQLLLTSLFCTTLPLGSALAEDVHAEFERGYFKFKSEDGNFQWKFDGRIMLDAKSIEKHEGDRLISTNTDLRRARFAIKTRFYKDWGGEFDIDYKNNKTKVKDMWVSYDPFENATIKVGNHKPFFSMAEVTTSRWYPLMETSSISDFTAPGRAIGLSMSYWDRNYFVGASIFGEETSFNKEKEDLVDDEVADAFQDYMEDLTDAIDDGDSLEDFIADEGTWGDVKSDLEDEFEKYEKSQERTNYAARAVFRPYLSDDLKTIVHLGANVMRKSPSAVDLNEFKMRAEPHDVAFVYNKLKPSKFPVEDINATSLELAARWNKVYFQSELINNTISYKDTGKYGALPDTDVSGYYAEVSYFILGEGRPYNLHDGEFGAVIPKNGSELEVIVRYDTFDANDGSCYKDCDDADPTEWGTMNWGKMTNLTFGVNWYVNTNIIMRLNYSRIETDENAGNDKGIANADINIAAARLEFLF